MITIVKIQKIQKKNEIFDLAKLWGEAVNKTYEEWEATAIVNGKELKSCCPMQLSGKSYETEEKAKEYFEKRFASWEEDENYDISCDCDNASCGNN